MGVNQARVNNDRRVSFRRKYDQHEPAGRHDVSFFIQWDTFILIRLLFGVKLFVPFLQNSYHFSLFNQNNYDTAITADERTHLWQLFTMLLPRFRFPKNSEDVEGSECQIKIFKKQKIYDDHSKERWSGGRHGKAF